MSSRLTDTDKWKDEWFISLDNDYKIVWVWLLDNCNHAGILKPGTTILNMFCNTKLTEEGLLEIFKNRVFKEKDCYFIPKFLKYQYGTLTSNRPVILSVIKQLENNNLLEFTKKYFNDDLRMITEPLDNDYSIIKRKRKDKDKDIIKVKDNNRDTIKEIINYLNVMTGKNFKSTVAKNRNVIQARLNEKFTFKDFKTVIDKKTSEWLTDPKMNMYLRPETLFGTKFESYLNQQLKAIYGNRNIGITSEQIQDSERRLRESLNV